MTRLCILMPRIWAMPDGPGHSASPSHVSLSRPYRASVRIADLLIMAAVAMFIGFALAVQL